MLRSQTNFIRRDLNWFNIFLPKFNGTAKYFHNDVSEVETLAIDAYLHGVGRVRRTAYIQLPYLKC